MRTNFSPTAMAARRLTARPLPPKPEPSVPPAPDSRWCEWPRRDSGAFPRASIWQTLQQIQARHA